MGGNVQNYAPPVMEPTRRLGDIQCFADCGYSLDPLWGPVGVAAFWISVISMLVYGFVLVGRPPSALRTAVKMLAVSGLAVAAAVWGSPFLLIAALLVCAVGDAFLAGDPKRWLTPGLAAFLLGHALYIFLFTEYRDPAMEPGALQLAAIAAVAVGAIAMLAFLWRRLGSMRPAVVLYVGVISTMTGSSFLLDQSYWPAMAGSIAFMASDAVLAISLFREEKLFGSPRATDWAVWFMYYAAQVLIAVAFMGRV